jgi:hypothetical protein
MLLHIALRLHWLLLELHGHGLLLWDGLLRKHLSVGWRQLLVAARVRVVLIPLHIYLYILHLQRFMTSAKLETE